ncbi:MAG: M48 family metalloprotease [DPANN group archaeon]|nr:M48 family metalloprotease [DPANN group archaeon]
MSSYRLFGAMAVTMAVLFALLSLVYLAALWFFGVNAESALVYMIPFVLFFTGLQWYIGPWLIKFMTRMRDCNDSGVLAMVSAEAQNAGVPTPKVYIVENHTPNAFAFGRTQKSSSIALHTGLLNLLDKDELRGVIAHEVGHIKHRDVIIMTLASVLPTLLFYIFYFGGMMAGGRDRNNGGIGFWLGAYFGGLIAQFIGSLLVLYLSRVREYHADEHSARATRNPDALGSALAKISYGLSRSKPVPGNAMLNSFYILDQATSLHDVEGRMAEEEKHGFVEIFMSHPLTAKRIKALRQFRP